MTQRIAHIAYVFLLGICFVPLLVQLWPSWSSAEAGVLAPLNGYQAPKAMPELTLKNWSGSKSGAFQRKVETGLVEHLRLRPALVRVNNQMKFSLFDLVKAKYTVYGKDGYFFSRRDINAYQGYSYIGNKRVQQLMRRLSCVRDTLAKTGTQVLFVIAPSKARFFPDHFPAPFNRRKPKKTFKPTFERWLESYDLPYLDYGDVFEELRNTAAYPLYAREGYHWSAYGAYLAADTLLRRIEQLAGHPMPHLELRALKKSIVPNERDNDMGAAANLMFQSFKDTLAYPQLDTIWTEGEPEQKARVLTIGDSYYSDFVLLGLPHAAYDPSWEFWYYNRQIRTSAGLQKDKIEQIPSLSEKLESQDLVLLIITEFNLAEESWKFIDQAFEAYYPVGHSCGEE